MSEKPTFFRDIQLSRYPTSNDPSLKAWNAADEYLLDAIAELPDKTYQNLLILNDQFGALSCLTECKSTTLWTDSFLSQISIQRNLEANQISQNLKLINQTQDYLLPDELFDLVIIRIPKHNSLLKFQLESLSSHLTPESIIIAAGMTKEIHKSNLQIFESVIGATTTSLAKKKARLIYSTPDPIKIVQHSKIKQDDDNNPNVYGRLKANSKIFHTSKPNLKVWGLPGVFSRENLDIGSRVLLDFLPKTNKHSRLIDLGCGTGVLGTVAAVQNSSLQVTFTDESYLAVESAKQTYMQNTHSECLPPAEILTSIADDLSSQEVEPSFIVTDVLDGLPNNHYHYILCNPPFHQQNVQTLSIANKMFRESSRKLTIEGELRVVANRHLKYRPTLNRYFSKVEIISNHPKFIVWVASKPKH
jgi:16S rRNA (guanine1207-N2)-methyltransferase